MFPASHARLIWPDGHPLCHITIPPGKTLARVEYEISRNRDHTECVQAATLFFSDGSELWIDLAAVHPGVSLTYQSAPDLPIAFKIH